MLDAVALAFTALPGYEVRSPNHVYMECPSDVTSCRDVATSHVTSFYAKRRGDCIAGVYCDEDLYESDGGICHPLQQCPCHDAGVDYQPGDVIHRSCADW